MCFEEGSVRGCGEGGDAEEEGYKDEDGIDDCSWNSSLVFSDKVEERSATDLSMVLGIVIDCSQHCLSFACR